MQLECSVDPGFKRTNKRDKFNELEDNVQRLQSIVEKHQAEGQNGSPVRSITNNHGENGTSSGSPPLDSQPSPPLSHSVPEISVSRVPRPVTSTSTSTSRSLGDVTLSLSEIEKLFNIYFNKYHAILPILDPEKSHTQYYEQSTMLFWTMLSIAMRTYEQDATLLTRLTPTLSTHLWSGIGACVRSIGGPDGSDITEIQTLLLLATWPLPSLRLWSDRSMTMSTMALTAGMHMGLHRPGFDAEYAREPLQLDNNLITERSSAWVAAYCSCVSIASENGHEALVPSKDWLINNVCSPNPTIYIPQELRHYAIIAKHGNDAFKFFTSMNDNPATVAHEPSFFPNVALCEKTLSEIDDIYSDEMSLANKVRCQGFLLLVQSMYFLSDQTFEQSRQGVLRAYTTATNILNILISDDNTNVFLLHAPNMFLRIIVRAAFVMLRTLFSTHGNTLDRTNGKTLFNTSVFFLRQMSVRSKEKDQAARVAEALKVMWRHMEGEPSFRKHPPVLKIQSRLGATLLYDSLFYYRRAAVDAQNGRPKSAQHSFMQAVTPMSVSSNTEPHGTDSVNIAGSDGWTTPSFESFLDSDLSWMDSLIDPVPFSGVS